MSCRVPIVLSSASCFREIAGEAALYFTVKDTQHLSHHLSELIENKKLREKMILLSKERVKEFSDYITTKKMLQIYKL